MGSNAPAGYQDRPDWFNQFLVEQAQNSAQTANRTTRAPANAGTGQSSSGLSSSLQSALKSATEDYNRIMGGGGGGSSGGGGSDGGMTAYQAAQLDLERQRLQQQNQQFNVGQTNDLYQFNTSQQNDLYQSGAALANNQSQFSQNYLLNYLTTMEELGGSDVDWARIDLDTRRQGLAEMLGAGELTQGFQKLDLAEQDMDIKRMLGMGDYQLGQAQVYSTLQRLGIDSRAADLDYQVQMARMGVDQQIAQARLMEAQGAASAAQAAAQADMARAQAALQAVQVELQLGNGNLELGRQKAADAMKLGMEDIAVRREDMGLRERLGSLDATVRMNIASMQAGTDMARLFQEGQFQKADLIAQLHGKPRDWLRAAEVQQAFAPGGEAASFGAPSGPIEMMDLNTFAQQNNLNLNPWGTPTAGGGNPWAQMVQQYMSGAGQMSPYAFGGQGSQPIPAAQQGLASPGAPGAPGAPGSGQPPPPQQPGPYNANGSLNYGSLGIEVYGDPNRPVQFAQDQLDENMARWQSMVARGHMTQEQMDQAIAVEKARIAADIAKIPEMAAAGMIISTDSSGATPVQGATDVQAPDGRRLRMYERDGQKFLVPIKQSGGSYMDAAGVIHQDFRDVDALGNPVGTEWGLPQQKNYVTADGYSYAVPSWAGPTNPGDRLVSGAPQYQVQNMQGQWVQEGSAAARGEPVINANGSVTMPDGSVRPPQTQVATGGATGTVNNPGSTGGVSNTGGSFTMPGASTAPVGGAAMPSAGGLPSYGSLPPVGDFYASLFSTNPFTTSGASGGSTAPASSSSYMQLYNQLLGQIGQGGTTTPTSRPPNEYDQLADALLAQMLGGQIPMQQGANGQYQVYTPTATTPQVPAAPSVPTGAQSPAVPTTPNSAYGYGTPATTQIQQGNTTGNPNWMPAWTPGSAYYPQSAPQPVSVTPDNYEQIKAYEDLKYLATKGPTDFINFPGQGGAQTMSKGGDYTQSWVTQNPGQTLTPALQKAQQDAQDAALRGEYQSQYSGYVNQYGSQLPTATTYQYPQWTNPNYSQPTQATAQNMQYQWSEPNVQDQHLGYGTDMYPQYATGTSYVPETGLAVVHQGEAIIPATQNPVNYGYGDEFDQRMAQLFAQQQLEQQTSQPVVPPVNAVTRAPSPTDYNSMAVPQPSYSPAQQTGQPPHAAPTTPSTGSYTPQPTQPPATSTALKQGAVPLPTNPNMYSVPGFGQMTREQAIANGWAVQSLTAPTSTSVTMPGAAGAAAPPAQQAQPQLDVQARAQDAITRVFGKYVAPSQVPLRIWNRMLPTTKEVLRGAWQAMGIQVDDVEHNIWQAGNTEGVAFQGQGYGSIGR